MKKKTQDKKMRKMFYHDAYLTDMKLCRYSETTQYKYYGQTPLKMLSLDNPLARNSKIGRPNQCGATLIASVSYTSKIEFYIHKLGEKKSQTN